MSDVESHECFKCSAIYDAGTRDACPKCGHAYIWSNGPPAREPRANGPRAGESETPNRSETDNTPRRMRVVKGARKGRSNENPQ